MPRSGLTCVQVPARSLAFLLALATLCAGGAPAPAVTEQDAGLAAGIGLVKEGDFESAVIELDAAVRGLDAAGRSAEAAQAYLYLGVAYLELDQEALARGKFAQALARQPQMSLDPGEFSPQVIRTFEATRQEALPPEASARTSASGARSPRREGAEQRKQGRSAVPYLILGGAAAAAGGFALAAGGGSSPSPPPGPSPSPSPSPSPPTTTCTFAVFPRGQQTVPANGGQGFCDVLTQPVCVWEAESTENWLLITPPLGSRAGDARVNFKLRTNNSGSQRDADVQIRHNGAVVVACRIRQLGDSSDPGTRAALASWASDLAVPGASGRLALDGAFVSLQGQGGSPGARMLAPGAHRFEALLTAGQSRPGVWRFRLRSGFRAGTLRVLAGEASVSADGVVFSLRGRPGERIVFTVDAER